MSKKFNLFDESTWTIDPEEIERKIEDQGVGNISSRIGLIKQLKDFLITSNNIDENVVAAFNLKQENPQAYDCMDIQIKYNDEKIAEVIKDCNYILDTWSTANTQEHKRSVWRKLVPYIRNINEYLNAIHSNEKLNFQGLTATVTVTGNAAWELYLKQQHTIKSQERAIKSLSSTLASKMEDEF